MIVRPIPVSTSALRMPLRQRSGRAILAARWTLPPGSRWPSATLAERPTAPAWCSALPSACPNASACGVKSCPTSARPTVSSPMCRTSPATSTRSPSARCADQASSAAAAAAAMWSANGASWRLANIGCTSLRWRCHSAPLLVTRPLPSTGWSSSYWLDLR